jgi:predicted metal-dependent phosphoesterase TrpH
MVVILPVIGPKITNINGYKIADIHSHTISSRDNISSMLSSINFHKKHGFTDFFVTEHDNTNGYKTIPNSVGREHIFPGIQIRTTNGVSVLLLSNNPFEYEDFKNLSIEELINLAHSKDMLVVMPHWWKWHRPDLQQLVDWGIDGFEIYNCGYRYISDQTRQQLINICNENNLPMFGTTDWHGLGYMTNVWTLIEDKDNKNVFELIKDKPKTKIVVHDIKGNQSVLRYIFEPFYFMYIYVTTTQLKYVVSFYMFILVLIGLLYNIPGMKIIRITSLLLACFFSVCIFYFIYILEYSFCNNVMIPKTIIPTAASLVFIWLVIWGFCDKNI